MYWKGRLICFQTDFYQVVIAYVLKKKKKKIKEGEPQLLPGI